MAKLFGLWWLRTSELEIVSCLVILLAVLLAACICLSNTTGRVVIAEFGVSA